MVETKSLRVEASRNDAERLALIVPGREQPVLPTHWSFGQMCGLIGAPASYLRQLPAPLAGINMQHGLLSHRAELVKTLEAEDSRVELRAVTGPGYGRIWDHELVGAVMRIAGDGTGDTRWKVPGLLDWSSMTHNPFVEVTKDTITLYASDRDVFLFLVDDAWPAMIAAVTDFDGRITGVHRIWLDPTGHGKVTAATLREFLIEQVNRLHPERLRRVPQRQQGDILLAALHAADMGAINAHTRSDGLLAEASPHPKPANISPEHLSDIHPQDGHHSRILVLRIIMRGIRSGVNAELVASGYRLSSGECPVSAPGGQEKKCRHSQI